MFVGEIFTVIVARLLWIQNNGRRLGKRASQSADGCSAQPIMGHNEQTNNVTGRLISASDEVSAAFTLRGGRPLTSAALPLAFWDQNVPLLHVWMVLVPLVWMWRRRRRLPGATPDPAVADVKKAEGNNMFVPPDSTSCDCATASQKEASFHLKTPAEFP